MEQLIPEQGPTEIGDISLVRSFQTFTPSVDEVFDWLWSNFSSLDRPKSGRVRNLTLEARIAQTYWRDRDTIGSGLEEVLGPRRTEVGAQVKYRF